MSGPDLATPVITVVVPHYDDPAGLDRCLDALVSQTLPASAYEVVVADNASPQGEAAVRALIGDRARLVIAHARGAGPARNAGLAVVTTRYVALTDADCIPDADWLRAGFAALTADGDGAMRVIGGKVDVLVSEGRPLSGAEAFERVFAFDNERYVTRKGFSVTANLMAPLTLFRAVGDFRSDASEDIDWCHRATARGATLRFEPSAVVAHPARGDWPALKRKWRRVQAERLTLARDARYGRLRWLLRLWALPPSIVWLAPRAVLSPGLSRRDRLAALGTLARLHLWRFADGHRRIFRPIVRPCGR